MKRHHKKSGCRTTKNEMSVVWYCSENSPMTQNVLIEHNKFNKQLIESQLTFKLEGNSTESSATQFLPEEQVVFPISPIQIKVPKLLTSSILDADLFIDQLPFQRNEFDQRLKKKLDYIDLESSYELYHLELCCLRKMKKCLAKTADPFLRSNRTQLDEYIQVCFCLKKKAKKELRKRKLKRLYGLFHIN